jgi:small redox-active disulfide protein 2
MKKIEILGTGCPKCKKLAETAEEAAKALGILYELKKVTDIQEIIGYGIPMTPAMVVDGEVKVLGRVPPMDEMKKLLGPGGPS